MAEIGPNVSHSEARRRLFGTRDVDLLSRPMLETPKLRGRGAASNESGRFEPHKREMFADGWEPEPEEGFETREHVERARAETKCDVSSQPLRWCADNLSSRSREMDEKMTKTGSREIRSRIH